MPMACLYQRGETWYAKYYVNGKPQYKSLETKERGVAKKKIRVLEFELARNTKTNVDGVGEFNDLKNKISMLDAQIRGFVTEQKSKYHSITLISEFLEKYFRDLEATKKGKSLKNERSRLAIFFAYLAEHHPRIKNMEDVTPTVINAFLTAKIVKDKVCAKTGNHYRQVIVTMFNKARHVYGYIPPERGYTNPAEVIKRYKEPAPQIRFLRKEEIHQQLEALSESPTIQAMVATYIYAGLRREELLWLTIEDVNLERREISVRAKTIAGESWQPKTRKNRMVPISQALYAWLEKYRPPANNVWFFQSPQGMRWDTDNFSSALRDINQEHGLEWSCLDYRHTFGSHLAMKGESLYKISELLGNSPEICRRHYAHLLPESLRDCVEFDNPDHAVCRTKIITFRRNARLARGR